MTDENPRKLPPLSPKSETGSEYDVPRRPRKKKKHLEQGGEDGEQRNVRSRSSSRRRGEDGEHVEAGTGAPRKKRSKAKGHHTSENEDGHANPTRRSKKTIGTSQEALVGPGEDAVTSGGEDGQPIPGQKKKKRKKKKARKAVGSEPEDDDYVGLAAELSAIADDVIDTKKEEEEADDDSMASHLAPPVLRSEPTNKVFIEQKGGFKTTDKEKLRKRQLEAQHRAMAVPPPAVTMTTIQFGLATHRVFKTFTLFCQGLFAGFALWQIVTVFTLSDIGSGYTVFLEAYSPVALPVQCLYYLLFALSIVAACDRYDIGRPSRRFVVRACTLQNGAISIGIYFLGLIFSLSIAHTDDKINLHDDEEQNVWDNEQDRNDELDRWLILNTIRGVSAMLGWLIIALKPTTDRLSKNLERADDNIYGDLNPEMNDMHVMKANGAV